MRLYFDENGHLKVAVTSEPTQNVYTRPSPPPFSLYVIDHKGDRRRRSEVHWCNICTLWWDVHEMRARGSYCKWCSNHYHYWRKQVKDYEKSTEQKQDTSMATFRIKYLSQQLTVSPPVQWTPEMDKED